MYGVKPSERIRFLTTIKSGKLSEIFHLTFLLVVYVVMVDRECLVMNSGKE